MLCKHILLAHMNERPSQILVMYLFVYYSHQKRCIKMMKEKQKCTLIARKILEWSCRLSFFFTWLIDDSEVWQIFINVSSKYFHVETHRNGEESLCLATLESGAYTKIGSRLRCAVTNGLLWRIKSILSQSSDFRSL